MRNPSAPLTLIGYHATRHDFPEFRTVGNVGQGEAFPLDGAFFAETADAAREFSDGRVICARLDFRDPLVVELPDSYDGEAWRNPMAEQEQIQRARRAGHDSLILINAETGERYFVAFCPSQIHLITTDIPALA